MELTARTALRCATLVCGLIPGSGLAAQDAAAKPFTPFVDLGFEERARNEHYNNTDSNSGGLDQRNQFRFRTRLWAVAGLTPDLELAAGLCYEARKIKQQDYLTYSNAYTGESKTHTQFNGREVFFETLYVKYKLSSQVSAKVGRQDIVRGEGFILMDGTPGDGSRSGYFNAVDLAYAWSQSKLEFIAIDDPAQDRFLPQINKIDRPAEANLLTEWDEQALGLYYSGKEWTGTTLDAYCILKAEKNFNLWNPTKVAFQPDRKFSTVGTRVAKVLGYGLTATGEFAYQFGHQDAGLDPRSQSATPVTAKNISAWGGYGRATKSFDAPWTPALAVGYIALSGQDPHSGKITAWDPVFSRFPKWSEYYAYALAPEKGVAYWQNLSMWQVEATCSPCKAVDLRATYYKMAAFEASTGTDKDRGNLYELRADMRFTPGFKGHVVYERMIPGNFKATNDPGYFFRAEVAYTFKHRFSL